VILHSSRKDEFWRECALLLASNFEPSQIGRVLDFGSYARGQMPVPAPEVPGHECSEEFFPGLDARPWHEPAQFPWIEGLELQAGVMQEELRSVLADSGRTFSGDSALQSQVMGSGWSAIRLQRLGRWNDETVQLFPKTYAALRDLNIPTAVRGVMFARMTPGSTVAPHSDGRNFILTCHLGLDVPEQGCWIEAAGQRKEWEEGKAIVLDTSFTHSTANQSDRDRYVLIIDFWHPGLTQVEREALQVVYDLRYEYDKGIIAPPSAPAPAPVKVPQFLQNLFPR